MKGKSNLSHFKHIGIKMKTLFIAGKPKAGKTTICIKLEKKITKSFKFGKPKVFKNPEDSKDKIFIYPFETSGQKKKRLKLKI